ncbi:MAG: hypothetical protein JKY15_06615 [Deltaproteobacteria bacterium]|nr:hypothetical protein [Deltaproteobacteria bacterium]
MLEPLSAVAFSEQAVAAAPEPLDAVVSMAQFPLLADALGHLASVLACELHH